MVEIELRMYDPDLIFYLWHLYKIRGQVVAKLVII